MIEVVGLGALNIDKVYKVERIAKPGEEVFIYDEHISPGGSAANTIYALAKLGIKTGFIGIIGDDYYSNIIIEEFKEAGVDISRIRVVKGRCGEVLCIVDKSGERCLYVNPGVNNLLTLNEDDLVYINSAKILHMSSFVGEKQLNEKKKLLNNIKALISFAPGHVYVEKGLNEIEDIVAKSYILFLNKSEAEILTGRNYKEAARMLLDIGSKVVVITLGKDGCYVLTKNYEIKVPAYKVKPVDTTGAGDAFAAGFIYGIIKGFDLRLSAKIANKVASYCIQKYGARDGIPSKDEIERFLKDEFRRKKEKTC